MVVWGGKKLSLILLDSFSHSNNQIDVRRVNKAAKFNYVRTYGNPTRGRVRDPHIIKQERFREREGEIRSIWHAELKVK